MLSFWKLMERIIIIIDNFRLQEKGGREGENNNNNQTVSLCNTLCGNKHIINVKQV